MFTSRTDGNEEGAEPGSSRGWRFFRRELAQQWSRRNRHSAILGLLGVLAVQVLVTLGLSRFLWGNAAARGLEIPRILSALLVPIFSPFPYFWSPGGPEQSLVLTVLQLSYWLAFTGIVFAGPAFAARSVAPDRENGRFPELLLAGLSSRLVIGGKVAAGAAPFVVLALGTGLLGAGLLLGAHLAGKHDLFGTLPPLPPGMVRSPRPDPFTSQCVFLAASVVGWLSLLTVMGAIGAVCRNTRAAMGWCYAVPFLIQPVVRYALTTLAVTAGSGLGFYRTSLVRVAVSILELAVAAWLFRRAVREVAHPEEHQGPWVEVRRPAMWDLSLSDDAGAPDRRE